MRTLTSSSAIQVIPIRGLQGGGIQTSLEVYNAIGRLSSTGSGVNSVSLDFKLTDINLSNGLRYGSVYEPGPGCDEWIRD